MRSGLAAALVLVGLACGGGGSGPQPAPSDPSSAPTPTTPGTPSSPGGPTSPSTPASPAGGAPDTGVTMTRLDAATECDALLPASAPSPVQVRVDAPAGATCVAGTSDGTGAVALAARDGSGALTWRAYTASGEPRAAFAAAQLATEPRGWQGLRLTGGGSQPLAEHVTIAPDGTVARAETVSGDPTQLTEFRFAFAQDPAGGCFILFRSVTLAGNHWHGVRGYRFDEAGVPRWPAPELLEYGEDSTAPLFMAGGVSTGGEALYVYQSSAFLEASWFDAGGTQVAAPNESDRSGDVVGSSLSPQLELKPLLDGGLALRSDGTWRRAYPRLATASAPLPGWLAARAAWTYQFARGNAGYAAFPPPGQASADCTQSIDLIAPSGRLCGRVTLRESGSGCTTGAVDQGWDGTVVQQSGHDACTFRWWPRLLAGG